MNMKKGICCLMFPLLMIGICITLFLSIVFAAQKFHIVGHPYVENGQGGNGFDKTKPYYFIYNKETSKGVQVIIKKTSEACALFNRLKEQDKNVMFVIHNS